MEIKAEEGDYSLNSISQCFRESEASWHDWGQISQRVFHEELLVSSELLCNDILFSSSLKSKRPCNCLRRENGVGKSAYLTIYISSLRSKNTWSFLWVYAFPEAFWHGRDLHYFHIHMLSLVVNLEIVMSFRVHGCQSFMPLDPCESYMAYIPQRILPENLL